MTDEIFPDQLKIARVTPIHKAGDTKSLTNYRPISVLPVFSKISEKLIYKRLLDCLNKYDILLKTNSGAVHKVCQAPGGGGLRKCDSLWQGG